MRIYLDVSCLNRPFDDPGQTRVRFEADAVVSLFRMSDAGKHEHVTSHMALLEIRATADENRRRRLELLLPPIRKLFKLTDQVFRRAAQLDRSGFKPADAVHLAAAELIPADLFLTCDDRLLRMARRSPGLTVPVMNPLAWLQEQPDA